MKKLFTTLWVLLTVSISAFAQLSDVQIAQALRNELAKQQFLQYNLVTMNVQSQSVSTHNKMIHVYANQTVGMYEILNANTDMHFTIDGKLISMHHNFIPSPQQRVNTGNLKLSSLEALNAALAYKGISGSTLFNKDVTTENGKQVWFDPQISSEKMFVKPGYFAKADQLILVYQVEFLQDETNDFWNLMVNATDGSIINESSYTVHCDFPRNGTYSFEKLGTLADEDSEAPALQKKSSNGTYNVFPLPYESPRHGPRSLMTNMSDAQASPFGWHDTNGVAGPEFTITRGNNVWAREDTLNNNGSSGGYSPDGGDSLVFDYPYLILNKPRNNMRAAITNTFYWNNIMHDIYYHYGFDEASGNYQQKQFTADGKGKDAVNADAMDGSGTSNANFSAPADGTSGRMQMYLWPTSSSSTLLNTLNVIYPVSIKGQFYGPQSVAGPRLTADGMFGQIVLVKDAGASTSYLCGTLDTSVSLVGKIALIDRGGSCGTQSSVTRTKILKAQQAGAIAVIIAHNLNGVTPTPVSGTDPNITIPSITVSYSTGVMLKTALQADTIYAQLFDSSELKPSLTYDSDFDNGVIAHEFGHGISIRLTGGPANSNCLNNQEQAGEGWSDFFCLALTTRPHERSATVARGIGTFVINEDTTGLGIRNYKYTRSMTVNPSTYNTIKSLSVPHGVGSVWCTMLYDMYWDMIDKYGFDPDWYHGTGGNNKMMQLVIDGLKLQPCSPGFIDSRNAIILADSINNGGANRELLWKGFARRGLGFYANQGSTNSRSDGTESYALPPDLATGSETILDDHTFNLYPNPAKDQISVDVFGDKVLTGVEIYDMNGRLVQQEKYTDASMHSAELTLNKLEPGCYLVKVISTDGYSVKKLLIN